jgi:hypothetical protein
MVVKNAALCLKEFKKGARARNSRYFEGLGWCAGASARPFTTGFSQDKSSEVGRDALSRVSGQTLKPMTGGATVAACYPDSKEFVRSGQSAA